MHKQIELSPNVDKCSYLALRFTLDAATFTPVTTQFEHSKLCFVFKLRSRDCYTADCLAISGTSTAQYVPCLHVVHGTGSTILHDRKRIFTGHIPTWATEGINLR